jgi:hypothetical protein
MTLAVSSNVFRLDIDYAPLFYVPLREFPGFYQVPEPLAAVRVNVVVKSPAGYQDVADVH